MFVGYRGVHFVVLTVQEMSFGRAEFDTTLQQLIGLDTQGVGRALVVLRSYYSL